ncbi:HEAT repeat domain-containing protein [Streptomyces sp. NPDC051940]|uniref:HEAT repeat domain-containing protein n=1 Tax=Streptomyces sp. NPDC051940 TaxID=3155675 RepID=UPI00342E8A8B
MTDLHWPPVPAEHAEPREWADYDRDIRHHWSWPLPEPASPPTPEEAAAALSHANGRIREAALDRDLPPSLDPLVLLRCVDSAAPVRESARRKLTAALGSASPDPDRLDRLLRHALHLRGRRHGGWALQEVTRAVTEADAWEPAYTSPDRVLRRFAFETAAADGRLPLERLARVAATDGDVIVQRVCAAPALRDPRPGVLDTLLTARATAVRADAVTALVRAGRGAEAASWLADRARIVRACAQWAVRQSGGDPAAHYRAAAPAPGVVAGLGECGTARDHTLLWPLLDHPRPAVRAEAVTALAVLGAAADPRVRRMLDDSSPRVRRSAAAALGAGPSGR